MNQSDVFVDVLLATKKAMDNGQTVLLTLNVNGKEKKEQPIDVNCNTVCPTVKIIRAQANCFNRDAMRLLEFIDSGTLTMHYNEIQEIRKTLMQAPV